MQGFVGFIREEDGEEFEDGWDKEGVGSGFDSKANRVACEETANDSHEEEDPSPDSLQDRHWLLLLLFCFRTHHDEIQVGLLSSKVVQGERRRVGSNESLVDERTEVGDEERTHHGEEDEDVWLSRSSRIGLVGNQRKHHHRPSSKNCCS
ncbi:hypothetical protein BDY24DRAFT_379957 [Mrakia frigida]|uniref:uncharacterized protein n=1 Tax=Mrakia frigida TaxID=29902 RepID=UPI003FCC0E30